MHHIFHNGYVKSEERKCKKERGNEKAAIIGKQRSEKVSYRKKFLKEHTGNKE